MKKKWINTTITGRSGQTVFLLCFIGVLCAVITSGSAIITRNLIDTAVSGGDVVLYILIFGAFLISILSLQIIYQYMSSRLTVKLELGLRRIIISTLIKSDYFSVQSYHSGDILNRATGDAAAVAAGVSNCIPAFVSSLVRIFSSLAVLYILDYRLGIILTVAAPVTFFIARFFSAKTKKLHKLSQEEESRNRAFMLEAVQNITVVKAMMNDEPVLNNFDRLQKENLKRRMRLNVLIVLAGVIMFLSVSFVYYLALIYCAYQLSLGIMSVAVLAAVLQLVVQFQLPFRSLSGVISMYSKMNASTERIRELENLKKDEVNTIIPPVKKIEINELNFSYEDNIPVISDLNAAILPGETVCVTGESGAGKSTFLKLLMSLYKPDSGNIIFRTNKGKYYDARARMSYVPQNNLILSGTVRDNITFFTDNVSESSLESAIEVSCLTSVVNEMPDGLDTILGENGLGVSQGQAQRIAIARALAMGKDILLLDEATSALDEQTEKEIINNLKSIGKTIILVTHRKALTGSCDRIINIK